MRTCVRVRIPRGDHPACRPGRVLRLGRAAGRPTPARPPGDRRRRRRPGLQLRGQGVRRPYRDERWTGVAPLPRRDRGAPRMSAYSEASKAVFKVFEDTTPLVEGLSIDEAFLDVGGLRKISGTPLEIARRLRADVLSRGRAADHGRGGADEVPGEGGQRGREAGRVAGGAARRELEFLHPLNVERLWGVGEVTAEKLRSRGLTKVGDVASCREAALVAMLGPGVRAAPARAGPQPRSRGRSRSAVVGGRSVRNGRSADHPSRRPPSTPSWPAWSTG